MIADYTKFVASLAIADRNVLIIFGIALAAVGAWYSIDLLPHSWHKPARVIAWIYAVLMLALTVVYSIGG
jgi:hypothetical protein